MQFGTAWSQQFVYRFVSMVRGILVTTIYRKTTSVSIVGLDDAAAVTLMSTDVERIVAGLAMMHEIWTTILQIGVSLFLLYRLIWVAIVIPLFMFLREYSLSPRHQIEAESNPPYSVWCCDWSTCRTSW